jgi:hypothetical protein
MRFFEVNEKSLKGAGVDKQRTKSLGPVGFGWPNCAFSPHGVRGQLGIPFGEDMLEVAANNSHLPAQSPSDCYRIRGYFNRCSHGDSERGMPGEGVVPFEKYPPRILSACDFSTFPGEQIPSDSMLGRDGSDKRCRSTYQYS